MFKFWIIKKQLKNNAFKRIYGLKVVNFKKTMEKEIEKEIKKAKLEVIKDYILELARRIIAAEMDLATLSKMDKNEVVEEKPSSLLGGVKEKVTVKDRIEEIKKAMKRNQIALEVARAKYEELNKK